MLFPLLYPLNAARVSGIFCFYRTAEKVLELCFRGLRCFGNATEADEVYTGCTEERRQEREGLCVYYLFSEPEAQTTAGIDFMRCKEGCSMKALQAGFAETCTITEHWMAFTVQIDSLRETIWQNISQVGFSARLWTGLITVFVARLQAINISLNRFPLCLPCWYQISYLGLYI